MTAVFHFCRHYTKTWTVLLLTGILVWHQFSRKWRLKVHTGRGLFEFVLALRAAMSKPKLRWCVYPRTLCSVTAVAQKKLSTAPNQDTGDSPMTPGMLCCINRAAEKDFLLKKLFDSVNQFSSQTWSKSLASSCNDAPCDIDVDSGAGPVASEVSTALHETEHVVYDIEIEEGALLKACQKPRRSGRARQREKRRKVALSEHSRSHDPQNENRQSTDKTMIVQMGVPDNEEETPLHPKPNRRSGRVRQRERNRQAALKTQVPGADGQDVLATSEDAKSLRI
jgi:hypothetical protein